MGLKFVYAGILFGAGFVLGYFANNNTPNRSSIEKVQLPIQVQASDSKANPFAILSSTQNEANTLNNSNGTNSETEDVSSLVKVENTVSSPEQDELIRAKLSEIGYLVRDEQLDQLAEGLGDSSPQVRRQTMLGLSDMNSDVSLQVIGQALMSDPLAENRLFALNILEKHQNVDFVIHFISYAQHNDKNLQVRQHAAKILGQY